MPVLFLHGDYDVVCETTISRLADPMRSACADLSEVVVPSGHWMAQEQPVAVNAAITRWLATKTRIILARMSATAFVTRCGA